MSTRIGIKALAIIRRPTDGSLLVGEAADPATGMVFHRGLGGTVEFGERAAQTVARELMEEIDIEVTVGTLLGVLENHFRFDDRRGHEIVFVYEADFIDQNAYERNRFEFLDLTDTAGPAPTVIWRPAGATPPLYPSGVVQLLDEQ